MPSILPRVIVRSVDFDRKAGVSRFEARIESNVAVIPEFTVRFDIHAEIEPPEALGDAWLAGLLLPAMFAGETLEVRAPVSHRLVRTSREVQRIFHAWYPALLSEVDVVTPKIVQTGRCNDSGPAACFFSGGVDSWYSFNKNRPQISALLTVKGFDLPFADEKIWPELVRANREIADEAGVDLIAIETDIRDRVDPGMGCFRRRYEGSDFWGDCFHGACLNAAGLLLQKRFSRIFIASSLPYWRLRPWGSHPLLDCLWSNGSLEFVHDGSEASRMDKVREICKVPSALQHLRVCPTYFQGRYNCGRCEKCRRTMLALRVFGVDEKRLNFDQPLVLRDIEMNPPPKKYLLPVYREILEVALTKNDPQMIRCLKVLSGDSWSPRYELRRWTSRMKRSLSKRAAFMKNLLSKSPLI